MACNSLKQIEISCGVNFAGGIKELYVIAYKDLAKISGTNQTYTYDATSKLIDEIGIQATKAFVPVGMYINSPNGVAISLQKDDAVGYLYWQHTLSLQLRGMDQEQKEFLADASGQTVAFIYSDQAGNYFASGLEGTVTMETAEGGTGNVRNDGRSMNVTFVGSDSEPWKPVDPELIPTILVPTP